MAKAKGIDVTPDEAYGRAAAEIVRVRARELFDHVEGVLDTGDIERVHDMRVASRRLRAVLEIFAPCFARASFRSVLADVKAIADALGERRDPDVHIDAMAAFAQKVTASQRPGVERLLERLRERQARGNEVLAAELERMGRRDLRARLMALADAAEQALDGEAGQAVEVAVEEALEEAVDEAGEGTAGVLGVKARKVKGLDPARSLADNAERIVRVRLDELCGFMPRAADPREVVALHDMRIAAKRLRYILEITAPIFGEYAVGAVKLTKDVQDLLGEIHDCDVQIPEVTAFLDELVGEDARALVEAAGDAPDLDPVGVRRAPHRREHAGLVALLVHLRARRDLLYARFVELWREYERKGYRARLEYAVSERAGAARDGSLTNGGPGGG